MQSLFVQALTLRQLGRLNSVQLLASWHGLGAAPWCPRMLHNRQLWGSATPLTLRSSSLPKSWDSQRSATVQQTRLKSSKKKDRLRASQQEEEEEDDPEGSDYEDELQDDPSLPKDYKDYEKVVQSLRYDVVLKAGLDVARHKIEDAFYDSKLRLNGEKLIKKSKTVKVGDTLDMIIEEDREMDKVILKRVVLKKLLGETKDADKQKILVRSWKHLQLPKHNVHKE